MPKKLMKTSEYRVKYFTESSRPCQTTINRWIERGDLPGTKIGSSYYVDVGKMDLTGNPLVDAVLAAS